MPIPANLGPETIVTVLTDKYNKNHLPLPANGETPVPDQWYWGGETTPVTIRPSVGSKQGVAGPVAPTTPVINIHDFFPGSE